MSQCQNSLLLHIILEHKSPNIVQGAVVFYSSEKVPMNSLYQKQISKPYQNRGSHFCSKRQVPGSHYARKLDSIECDLLGFGDIFWMSYATPKIPVDLHTSLDIDLQMTF